MIVPFVSVITDYISKLLLYSQFLKYKYLSAKIYFTSKRLHRKQSQQNVRIHNVIKFNLFLLPFFQVQSITVFILGNVVSGTNEQTQVFLDTGAMHHFPDFLSHSDEKICRVFINIFLKKKLFVSLHLNHSIQLCAKKFKAFCINLLLFKF